MNECFGELRGLLLIIAYRADHVLAAAAHSISAINAHIPGRDGLMLDLYKSFYHAYTPLCNALRIILSSSAVAAAPLPSRAVIPDRSAAPAIT